MKQILTLIIAFSVMAMGLSCSSAKKTVDTPTKETAADYSTWVNASNEYLKKIPVDGFDYKVTTLSYIKWDRWAKNNVQSFRKIVDGLPEGYVLEIKGHTDSRGPEERLGDKPGNMYISAERAKTVYESLKKQGIPESKLRHRGVASTEPIIGPDPKSPQQRRVTFKVVPR